MEINSLRCVLQIIFLVHIRHENNRELKSLALMDTHYPYNIIILGHGVRLSHVHLIFLQLINIPQKIEQTVQACIFVLGRLVHKHVKIRHPALSVFLRCRIDYIFRIVYEVFYQLMDWHIGSLLSVCVRKIKEFVDFDG